MSRSVAWLVATLCIVSVLSLSYAKPAKEAPLKGFLLVAERPRGAGPGAQPRAASPGAASATVPSGGYGPGGAAGGGGGEAEGIIGIIDVENNEEVGRIPEGGIISHFVQVVPGTNLGFVPIYGTGGVGTPGTDGTKITVLDLAEKKQIDAIDLGHGARPHQAFFNPKDGLLYVSTERDYALTLIDPKTRKVVGAIPTGQPESHDFVFSRDYKRIYTVNVFAGTISVLDVENRKLLNIVPIITDPVNPNVPAGGGGGAAFRTMMVQRISISPDGKYVFTQDQRHQALAMLDTKNLKVVGSIALPQRGLGSNVTPDGKYALATGNDQVAVVDIKEQKVIKSIPVGKTPQEIFIRPDGKYAYVTANNAGYVTAIKLEDWTTSQLNIGETNAEGMTWWDGPK
jgi:YVTN family beta-propeller protein